MGKRLQIGGFVLLGLIVIVIAQIPYGWTLPKSPQQAVAPAAPAAAAAPAAIAASPIPAATSLPRPTATPPPPTQEPQPTPAPPRLIVTGAGADGASLRATAGTGDRLKLLKDGTELIALGEERQAAGRAWKRVKDADGTEGWVAGDFVTDVVASAPLAPAETQAETTSASMSPEVKAYLEYMQPKLQVADQALGGLSQQSKLAGDNPKLIADADWLAKTAIALAIMSDAGGGLQKYEGVPKEAEKVDALMVALGKDLVYVADEYAAGLDQANPQRILNAFQRMREMNPKLPQALVEVQALSGQ